MEKLYLLDAYALIYRAYYAMINSPRMNSKGENTSAVFGFVNTLEDLLRHHQPDYLAVAFDPAGPTFRHEAYPEYKAQREATPEDIRNAVPLIKDIIRAYRIPILEAPGYEADDVIGTVAQQAAASGLDVYMLTPDKDYAQLVAPNITMCRPGRGGAPMETLNEAAVCEKYQLTQPTQVIDLLALMGDASDNIPGCPGVGQKTAQKLLGQFGSVEQLISRTGELKGALRKKVEENTEKIKFSKFLVTIRTDVPIEVNLEELRRSEPDTEELRKLFERLEFHTFLKRLSPEQVTTSKKQPEMASLFDVFPSDDQEEEKQSNLTTLKDLTHKYHLIQDLEDAKNLCDLLLTKQTVCIDTETTSTEAVSAELVGMSFCADTGEAWYVSVPRETSEILKYVEVFRPLYESDKIVKVGQNLKYDLNVLARYGAELRPPMFDTMLAHYVGGNLPPLRHHPYRPPHRPQGKRTEEHGRCPARRSVRLRCRGRRCNPAPHAPPDGGDGEIPGNLRFYRSGNAAHARTCPHGTLRRSPRHRGTGRNRPALPTAYAGARNGDIRAGRTFVHHIIAKTGGHSAV